MTERTRIDPAEIRVGRRVERAHLGRVPGGGDPVTLLRYLFARFVWAKCGDVYVY